MEVTSGQFWQSLKSLLPIDAAEGLSAAKPYGASVRLLSICLYTAWHHAIPPAGRSLRSIVYIRRSKLLVLQLPKWEVVQHAKSSGTFAAEGWAPNIQGADRRINVSRHLLRREQSAGGLSHGEKQ